MRVPYNNVVINSGGSRVLIGQQINAIKNVQVTVQADGNNGVTARIIDKSSTLGPIIEVLNSSGASVNGLIDATIQAY